MRRLLFSIFCAVTLLLAIPTSLIAHTPRAVVLLDQASYIADTSLMCKYGECAKAGGPGAIIVLEVHDLESGTNTATLLFYYLDNGGARIAGAWAQTNTVSTTTTETLAICSGVKTAGALAVNSVESGCFPPSWEMLLNLADAQPITVSVIAYYMEFSGS